MYPIRHDSIEAGSSCRLGDLLTVCGKPVRLRKGPLEERRDAATVPNKYSLVEVQAKETLTGPAIEMGEADLSMHSITLAVLRNDPTARWIGVPAWLRFRINGDKVADVDYLRALLLTPEMQTACQDLSYGMIMRRLTPEELLELRIPLKTRTQQKEVGAKLRAELKTVERLERQKRAILPMLSSFCRTDPEQL